MSKLTIQQWFARAVAAGLMPGWNNIWAQCQGSNTWELYRIVNRNRYGSFVVTSGVLGGEDCVNNNMIHDCESCEYYDKDIQLRKDGVDLVELWTKEDIPTKKNIGDICWFCQDEMVILDTLLGITKRDDLIIYHRLNEFAQNYTYDYCLLATNGNIAPTPKDFKKVYGEV